MKWEKKGLIFCPNKENEWMDNSFLQPTPIVLQDRIRIFGGIRDAKGVSRIGYVEVEKDNPSIIIRYSSNPVLDIGKDGMFDDNGVTPTSLVAINDRLYLYYAGYTLGTKVRFRVFSGIAVSDNGGEKFVRIQENPITDRAPGEELFRVVHSVVYDKGVYKFWYGGGNYFIQGKNKTLPVYDIRYMESLSLLEFPKSGIVAIPIIDGNHRVGRPFVFLENDIFKMFYGYGSEEYPYRLAYAESNNGIQWKNKDINIDLSSDGWDSEMMAYPSFIRVDGKGYLFYNGNNYGYGGFGYAQLVKE
ncbi:glycoside hydrolase family 32 protein [Campylobacter jejuni]|nr:glycoside hydrolase family 32 protein [Campylobacter jejuni]